MTSPYIEKITERMEAMSDGHLERIVEYIRKYNASFPEAFEFTLHETESRRQLDKCEKVIFGSAT